MKFTKMHGIGNDYVYVDGFAEKVADPVLTAKKVSDRHFGIGGDGLILIVPSDMADVRMRMFNADGSESEMCGNGVRCVAKYAYDHGLTKNNPMRIETGRGVLTLDLKTVEGKVREVTVNMGEPILEAEKIPVELLGGNPKARLINVPGDALTMTSGALHQLVMVESGILFKWTAVSMGNPHVVFYSQDVAKVPLETIGPQVERSPVFPRRINAHWVQVHSPGEVTMRTWERGSGITLACGTGACAVCVAGVLTGRTARKLLAHLPGGDLTLEWREGDNCVYMTGPATEVFTGEWGG